MKILPRYLFINMLKPLLYLLLAFTMLFIIGDLMDDAEDFLKSGISAWMLLKYYSLLLPSMVIFIVPICLLLATLYSLSMLTRHAEITAMRASGVSIYRIVRPFMLMGFICFLLTAVVNEYTGPKFAYRADQLLESQKENSEDAFFENIAYKDPSIGHEWHIAGFDTRTFTMKHVEFLRFRPDGSTLSKTAARKGHWLDGRWWFEDGSIQYYDEENNLDGEALTFQTREMRDLPETPENFMIEAKDPAHQSSLELWHYIESRRFLSHEKINALLVDLHHKLTMPFICLIATLIGIPVGAHTGRKGALAGIMLAIVMFFGFYAMQFTMEYFAKQMLIAPWVGAWTAVITFYCIGSLMIYRMR